MEQHHLKYKNKFLSNIMGNTFLGLTRLLALLVIFSLAACEEVIDIDLNSSNPVLNVEGRIEKDEAAWVQLSYTSDYFNNEEPTYSENATVTLTSNNIESEVLQHMGNGYYKGSAILGQADVDYTIQIENDGALYQAVSELYAPVEILDVVFEEFDRGGRPGNNEDSESYQSTITFTDDPSNRNYYLIKFWNNSEYMEGTYVLLDDEYYSDNGLIKYQPLFMMFSAGSYKAKVYSIDKSTYEYYSQLNDLIGEGMDSGTPYNPTSNFGSDIMGYFVAWSIDSMEGTVAVN